jgi:hypothetical protein
VGWRESKYRPITSRDWIVFGKGYDKIQAFRSQIINFSRTILGEDLLRITGEDALASVAVIEAAYRSLHHANWTTVDNGLSLRRTGANGKSGSNGTHVTRAGHSG